MTKRVEELKQRLLAHEHVQYRRHEPLSVLDDPAAVNKSLVERKALAFAKVLERMPLYILDGELIVGGRSLFGRADPTGTGPTFSQRSEWSLLFYPRYATNEEKEAVRELHIGEGMSLSHTQAGYQRVLAWGFGGLVERAKQHPFVVSHAAEAEWRPFVVSHAAGAKQHPFVVSHAAEAEWRPFVVSHAAKRSGVDGVGRKRPPPPRSVSDYERKDRRDFLRAVIICCEACGRHILRYADFAEEKAAGEPNPVRRAELHQIANDCRAIACGTPQTFRQAVQLLWFAHTFALIENYSLMSVGRFDQWMLPFYKADLAAGRLTEEEALELIECLWIKFNETADINTDDGLNVVLSGLTPEGRDGTNELTALCLETTMALRLCKPQINVRLHRDSPEWLLRKCAEVARLGMGYPSLFNDDAIVPAFTRIGISVEDARDYVNDGCTEVFIGGKSDFYPVFAGVNLLHVLQGVVSRLEEFDTFDELLTEFKAAIAEAVQKCFRAADARDRALARLSPVPFLSATLEGCIESARDKTAGGAKYNHTGSIGGGLVNCANALAAIKRLVFEERRIDRRELLAALSSNFADCEPLRQLLLTGAPKFGNGDDGVDAIAAEVARCFCEEVLRYRNPRGGRYLPGFFQYHYVAAGKGTQATPDGRKNGDPLAVDLSPYLGTAHAGPTAVLRSVSRIDPLLCPLGSSTDIRLHPTALAGDDGVQKMAAFLRAFVRLGNMQLQMNVVSAHTLRDAQQHPERYQDLVVRVWGFNAYFVTLARDYQDYIIERTEQAW